MATFLKNLMFPFVTIMVCLSACREGSTSFVDAYKAHAINRLTEVIRIFPYDTAKCCARMALDRLNNGRIDNTPTIIFATLTGDVNEPQLHLIYVDEDMDTRGIVIRETHRTEIGNKTVLEERYPVEVDSLESFIFSERTFFNIKIRQEKQHKNAFLWMEYLCYWLDRHISTRLFNSANPPIDSEEEMEMPTIYVSNPESNNTRVTISVYDWTGHESEPIELQTQPYFSEPYESNLDELLTGH